MFLSSEFIKEKEAEYLFNLFVEKGAVPHFITKYYGVSVFFPSSFPPSIPASSNEIDIRIELTVLFLLERPQPFDLSLDLLHSIQR